jgi:hypothetical protein
MFTAKLGIIDPIPKLVSFRQYQCENLTPRIKVLVSKNIPYDLSKTETLTVGNEINIPW